MSVRLYERVHTIHILIECTIIERKVTSSTAHPAIQAIQTRQAKLATLATLATLIA